MSTSVNPYMTTSLHLNVSIHILFSWHVLFYDFLSVILNSLSVCFDGAFKVALYELFCSLKMLLNQTGSVGWGIGCSVVVRVSPNSVTWVRFQFRVVIWLTLSRRELSYWRVKSSGVGQSKIIEVLCLRERIKVTLVTCEKSVVQFDSTEHRRFSPGTPVSSCSNTGPVKSSVREWPSLDVWGEQLRQLIGLPSINRHICIQPYRRY